MPTFDKGVDLGEFKTDKPEVVPPVGEFKMPTPAPDLPISDADKDAFFDCIMNNKCYREELTAFGGKFKAIMRTRTVKESEEVLLFITESVKNKKIDFFPDYQNKHVMCHVGLAVVSVNGENNDSGSIEERLKRIQNLNSQIYMILCEFLQRFDSKIERLREEALKVNF